MRKLVLSAVFITVAAVATAATAPKEVILDSKIESMQKAGVGPVVYPHTLHDKLFKCNECHPKVFKEKKGANDISMKKNMEGNFCGAPNCHNSPKAFPLYNCAKCHTKVKAAK